MNIEAQSETRYVVNRKAKLRDVVSGQVYVVRIFEIGGGGVRLNYWGRPMLGTSVTLQSMENRAQVPCRVVWRDGGTAELEYRSMPRAPNPKTRKGAGARNVKSKSTGTSLH